MTVRKIVVMDLMNHQNVQNVHVDLARSSVIMAIVLLRPRSVMEMMTVEIDPMKRNATLHVLILNSNVYRMVGVY